jgi:hypothetical protein
MKYAAAWVGLLILLVAGLYAAGCRAESIIRGRARLT